MRANLTTIRHSGAQLRLRLAPVAVPAYQRRFKTSKDGEEGQFKAVTASQSGHEPTENKLSKPPHKAAQPEVKRKTPTAWGSEKEKSTEKKDKTDRL
ncbi:uncharacterized protein LMH87_008718 [Akanthomyces muscarius]|uniref:Uncharacterized protein n=1 Tax=Akanthomyces muscarius TaxID=2231603 RepID=A0A9W8QJ84_AKAMU|nr:uncharacterized protein LMH87_008718 [Akanthomyces muscarius]KAJ4158179.1 hypothetical protein LMH87_008718 [Akanthomyces muscarius]